MNDITNSESPYNVAPPNAEPLTFQYLREAGINSGEELVQEMNRDIDVGFTVNLGDIGHILRGHSYASHSDTLSSTFIVDHRAWQTVKKLREEKGLQSITKEQFYDVKEKPTQSLVILGRQVHESLLRVLDRSENRNIQTLNQLVDYTNISEGSLLGFFRTLHYAYKDHGAGHEPSPNPRAQALAKALDCNPQDIVSLDIWRNAMDVHINPEADVTAPENPAPPRQTVYEHMRDSGIADSQALTERMNANPAVAARAPAFNITRDQVVYTLSRASGAYGTNGIYLTISHHRILQTINEARAEIGKSALTPFEFYGAEEKKASDLDDTQKLTKKIYNNLLVVLDRPQNRYIQTMELLDASAELVHPSTQVLLRRPWQAYSQEAKQKGEGLKASKTLAFITMALECKESDIVPEELWEESLKLHTELEQARIAKEKAEAEAAPADAEAAPTPTTLPEGWPFSPNLMRRVEDAFSRNVAEILYAHNIRYIGDVVHKTEDELKAIMPNFVDSDLVETKGKLAEMELSLGMQVPGWPPEDPTHYEALYRSLMAAGASENEPAPGEGPAATPEQPQAPAPGNATPEGGRRILQMLRRLNESGFSSTEALVERMNARPEVVAKNGDSNVTPHQITIALTFSNRVYGTRGAFMTVLHHRILQTVNEERVSKGLKVYSAKEFYNVEEKLEENAQIKLGRVVYNNFLKILDQPENRHFQSMEQITAIAGIHHAAIVNFLMFPWKTYSIHAEARGEGLKANTALAALVSKISCEPSDIVPKEIWDESLKLHKEDVEKTRRAAQSDADAVPAPPPAPRSTPAPRGARATSGPLATMRQYLSEIGIDNYAGLADLMNKQPAVAAKGEEFHVTPNQARMIYVRPDMALGQYGTLLVVTYHRALQAVNTAREEKKLQALKPHEFYTSIGAASFPMLGVITEVHNNLLKMLDRPRNMHIQSMEQLHKQAGLTNDALFKLIHAPRIAYSIGKDDTLIPNNRLTLVAIALGCKEEEIVSREMWGRAQQLYSNAPAAAKPTTDAGAGDQHRGETTMDTHTPSSTIPREPPTSGAEVVKILDAIGFTVAQLTEAINAPGKAAEKEDAVITPKGMQDTIDNRSQAYGRTRMFVGPLYARITQVVNEKLAAEKSSEQPFTPDALFGVTKRIPAEGSFEALSVKAHENYIAVLQRPQNRYLIGSRNVTRKMRMSPLELSSLLRDVHLAYEGDYKNLETQPLANPKLGVLVKLLECEVGDIVSVDLWRSAAQMKATAQSATPGPQTPAAPQQPAAAPTSPAPATPPATEPAAAKPEPAPAQPAPEVPVADAFARAALEVLRKLEQLRQEKPRVYSLIVRIAQAQRIEPNDEDANRVRLANPAEEFHKAMSSLTVAALGDQLEPRSQLQVTASILAAVKSHRDATNDESNDDVLVLNSLEGFGGLPKVADNKQLRDELPHLEHLTDRQIQAARTRGLRPTMQELETGFRLKVA